MSHRPRYHCSNKDLKMEEDACEGLHNLSISEESKKHKSVYIVFDWSDIVVGYPLACLSVYFAPELGKKIKNQWHRFKEMKILA